MKIKPKIENPITLKIKKNKSVVLADGTSPKEYSLIPGVMFKEGHYGIVMIIDHNNNQEEYVYPTQCDIEMLGIEGNKLKIYEKYKKKPWIFNKSTGVLEHDTQDDFTLEGLAELVETSIEEDNETGEAVIKNPVTIEISENNPQDSRIIVDNNQDKKYPLYPGVMLGKGRYGFVMRVATAKGIEERTYGTDGSIEAVGKDKEQDPALKIFEAGKYHPWRFDDEGNLVDKACIYKNPRKDKTLVLEKRNI